MGVLKKLLKIIVSSILLWILFKKLDWNSFIPILRGLKWSWIVPIFILGPIGILMLAIRWRLFLSKLCIDLSLTQATRGVWTGAFFNVFLPGSTGGDFYRLIFVRNLFPKSETKITSSLILDRLFGVGSLLFLGILGVIYKKHLLLQMLTEVSLVKKSKLCLIVCSCTIAFILVLFILKAAPVGSWISKFRDFLWAMVLQICDELGDINLVLKAFGLALGMHLISFTTGYFISNALSLNIGFIELALFTSVSAFILALPISINGFGVREVLLVGFFHYNGFSCGAGIGARESAIVFSLVGVVCDLIRVVPGGIWFALSKEPE